MTTRNAQVYLVRHGEAEGAAGRAIGHTDLPLSLAGIEASRALGATAHDMPRATVVTSPLLRARATADLVAAGMGVASDDIVLEPRLREMHFGEWDGRRWDDIQREDTARCEAFMAAWTECRTPGGEGYPDLLARVEAWVASQDGRSGDLVVVAHAGSIRALLSHWLKLAVRTTFQFRLDHAHVTSLSVGAHGAELLYLNADRFR